MNTMLYFFVRQKCLLSSGVGTSAMLFFTRACSENEREAERAREATTFPDLQFILPRYPSFVGQDRELCILRDQDVTSRMPWIFRPAPHSSASL